MKAWSGASDAEVVGAPGAVEGGCGWRGRNIRRAVLWQLVVAQEAPYGMCQVVVAPQREQGSATRSGLGGFGVDRVNTPSFRGFRGLGRTQFVSHRFFRGANSRSGAEEVVRVSQMRCGQAGKHRDTRTIISGLARR